MKILFVHNFYQQRGGEEAVLSNEMELLKNRGHEVMLFSKDSKDFAKLNFFKKITTAVKFFKSFDASYYSELVELIIKNRPDIVHLHNIFPLLSPSIYHLFDKYHIPMVQTVHNYRFLCINGLFLNNRGNICELCKNGNFIHGFFGKCYQNSYLKSFFAASVLSKHHRLGSFLKVSRYIAPSNFLKDKLLEAKIPKEKIVVKPHFIKDEGFGYNSDFGNYAVYMGRLSREKGLFTLLRAWKQLPDIELKIIGDGILRQDLEEFVIGEGIKNVNFLGFISGRQRFELLNKALCMVFPSQCYENSPYAIIESFACGVPVVAARLGGIAELIDNEETGLYFNTGDSDDLACKVKIIFENNSLSQKLRKNARCVFEAKYISNKDYDALINIYNGLLKP